MITTVPLALVAALVLLAMALAGRARTA